MTIVRLLLNAISPTLRKMIEDFANQLKKSALESDNPIDDIAVYLLFLVLGMPWD